MNQAATVCAIQDLQRCFSAVGNAVNTLHNQVENLSRRVALLEEKVVPYGAGPVLAEAQAVRESVESRHPDLASTALYTSGRASAIVECVEAIEDMAQNYLSTPSATVLLRRAAERLKEIKP